MHGCMAPPLPIGESSDFFRQLLTEGDLDGLVLWSTGLEIQTKTENIGKRRGFRWKGGGDKDQFLFCTLKLRPLYAVPLGWPIVSLCISLLNQKQSLHPNKPLKMIVCLNVL